MSRKHLTAPWVLASACAVSLGFIGHGMAQSKYSGIYQGKAGGTAFIVAVTGGGRVFGTDNTTKGLSGALDPAKSTVSSSGKLNAKTPSGTIVTGKVSTAGQIKGTVKVGKETLPLSGKRTFK